MRTSPRFRAARTPLSASSAVVSARTQTPTPSSYRRNPKRNSDIEYIGRVERQPTPVDSTVKQEREDTPEWISTPPKSQGAALVTGLLTPPASDQDDQDTADEDGDGYLPGVYIVERIMARSWHKGILPNGLYEHQLLVRWEGYGPEEDTWESESELRDSAREKVQEFDRQGPSYSLITSRREGTERHWLVRFTPDTPTCRPSPLAEEVWLTYTRMALKGMKGIKDKIAAWEQDDRARRLRSETPVSEYGVGSKRKNGSAGKKGKGAKKKGSSKGSPAATLLRVICRTSKVRKWRAQKSYKAEKVRYQVEYALRSEPNDSVLEAEFERPHMDRIFGKTVVLAKLAEWRERQKVDQEAVQRANADSEYEIERKRRIEENFALMRELGL